MSLPELNRPVFIFQLLLMNKMRKKNKMNLEKKIVLAEALFILGVFVYLFFASAPRAISPINGMTVLEPDFIFEIQNGESVLISYDENFTSPVTLSVGDEITLPPGEYFWKVLGGFRESEIQVLNIGENVGLEMRKNQEKYLLENTGNVDLNVSDKNGKSSFSMSTGSIQEVEDKSYEGRKI
jgi:hypothetical protein